METRLTRHRIPPRRMGGWIVAAKFVWSEVSSPKLPFGSGLYGTVTVFVPNGVHVVHHMYAVYRQFEAREILH